MNNKGSQSKARSVPVRADRVVDVSGTVCPVPIIELAKAMVKASPGEVVLLVATDPAVERDLRRWAAATGNQLLALESEGGVFRAYIGKAG